MIVPEMGLVICLFFFNGRIFSQVTNAPSSEAINYRRGQ
jgi:hypothetical protein